MHEAGLAIAIAAEIRARGLDPAVLRLRVVGAHDPDAFEASLRAHLEVAAGDLALERLPIEHATRGALCADCGSEFEADARDATCPVCGGPALPANHHERVELVWPDGPDWQA